MYKVPFRDLPGFISMNQYPFEHLFFEDKIAAALFEEFKMLLNERMEQKRFLPIMRMCDGEYIFCLGKKRGKHESALRYLFKKIFHKKQITSWGETYSKPERKMLASLFPRLLQEISKEGLIANHFLYSHTGFCEEYIQPMIEWYKENGIKMNASNYTSFYFIYVLLNGPECKWLYKQRRILVISSFAEEKRNAVKKSLLQKGAI